MEPPSLKVEIEEKQQDHSIPLDRTLRSRNNFKNGANGRVFTLRRDTKLQPQSFIFSYLMKL
ncbi:hypothetical protein PHPALM_27771 [Phytophthora palmivora]|uniref:Uncharacterized protein n=1 Tax=Phytophthora palmivora TaxID=4796 RepID=A0A2P4XBS6_9STRA|nr:hypothetical protein PHPALM_27771 [Phytophthora palmivora]